MLFWIIVGLALHIIHVFSHALMRFGNIGFAAYVGPRDTLGDPGVLEGRALRATNNFKENLPLFLTPAILALAIDGANISLAILGAQVFIVARIIYFAAYVSGIPMLRSPFYGVGLAGCVMILAALF